MMLPQEGTRHHTKSIGGHRRASGCSTSGCIAQVQLFSIETPSHSVARKEAFESMGKGRSSSPIDNISNSKLPAAKEC